MYVSESYSDADNTEEETSNGSAGELPDYHLVTARVGRDFAVGGDRVLNLGLAVNNLLDEDYYFRGVDVSPVGRVPQPVEALSLRHSSTSDGLLTEPDRNDPARCFAIACVRMGAG